MKTRLCCKVNSKYMYAVNRIICNFDDLMCRYNTYIETPLS